MFLLARPLTRLVLIVALVPTNAIAQAIPVANVSDQERRGGTAFLINGELTEHASEPLTGSLEESLRSAARELSATQVQPSSSDKKRLLWTGAALVGGGLGLVAVGLGEECRPTSGFPPIICRNRSSELAVGGLIVSIVGSGVLVKSRMSSASKKQILGAGAALLGGGIGLMAIGFGDECTYEIKSWGATYRDCNTRSEGVGWGGLTTAVIGSVVLANGVRRTTIPTGAPSPAPSAVPSPGSSPVPTAAAFANLSDHIRPEDAVSITETNGRRTEGRVTELTPSSLTLIVSEMDRRTFPLATVRRITVKDSAWNGALIGFVAGTIPAALLSTAFLDYAQHDLDGGRCDEKNTCRNSFPAGLAMGLILGGLPGLVIGAGIDAGIQRTIDVAPPRRARVTVLPVISRGRRAVLVSIRF